MVATSHVRRALTLGAFRSLRACSLPANDPLPVAIWRRYKWNIISVALFLLIDLVGIGSLIGGRVSH